MPAEKPTRGGRAIRIALKYHCTEEATIASLSMGRKCWGGGQGNVLSYFHVLHVMKECVISVSCLHLRIASHDVTFHRAIRDSSHFTELL